MQRCRAQRTDGALPASASYAPRVTTPSERRAIMLLTIVATLGVIVRISRAAHRTSLPAARDERALMAQLARVDSARAGSRRGASPGGRDGARAPRAIPKSKAGNRGPQERPGTPARDTAHTTVDLDVATAAEIEALPWIGPALAERIVASRNRCGPFGSVESLKRVFGIGDAMAKRLAPYVTFSPESRPLSAAPAPGCESADRRAATRRRGRA